MRRLRFFSIVLFGVAVLSFVVFQCREKIVTDRKGPEITMESDSITVSADADESELLKGITATDDRDGDVTDCLIVESTGHFVDENTRRMTVAAFDSSGNITRGTRDVVYSDYHSPHFTLSAPLRFPLGTEDIMANLGATDQLDGDLSGQVKVAETYTLSDIQPDDYTMEFTVTNSAGDVSRLTATVSLYSSAEETQCPQILLSDYIVYTPVGKKLDPQSYIKEINLGQTTIDASEVTIEDDVDYQKPGTYEIEYRCTKDKKTGSVRLIVVVEA
ncbi:MAG: hypothetical protein ACI4PQ_05645 [Butyricicoccaceae bacterium]